jgi:acetyl esterase/lipase
MRGRQLLIISMLLALAIPVSAQLPPTATFAAQLASQYQMASNVTYRIASNQQLKMDVYYRRGVTTPQPTLVYMHGGFWVAGAKETAILGLVPWMEMGWNVVNVEYRIGVASDASTLAPAAVVDCFCALRFVAGSAAAYNIDVNRIVVTGESAGGHLALAMGMIPENAVSSNPDCAGASAPARGTPAGAGAVVLPPMPKVAAVINWFGITDVPDVIEGPNSQPAAVRWFGDLPNKMEIAKRVSPLVYVRPGLPPILTVHGDSDTTVPYPEAIRLHQALAEVNVPNQLLTIDGGRHGNFTADERAKIYTTIREFLAKNGLGPK